MTAIKPNETENALKDKIKADDWNSILNEINEKYTEMDKYIGNLQSDILSIKDFEKQMLTDKERGYDVGTSLDTLGFQKDSLQIDHDFFVHMKDVYIKKLYGDLYKYCDNIIESALDIENISQNLTREKVKTRKFRNMIPYPPKVDNPNYTDDESIIINVEEEFIDDPSVKYDMNAIFALLNAVTSNLRELADDIGIFYQRINNAKAKESRGFSVGNLIMNLESQKQRLTLQFDSYITRLEIFLEQNKSFSARCLNRIKMISDEIVTTDSKRRRLLDTENQTEVSLENGDKNQRRLIEDLFPTKYYDEELERVRQLEYDDNAWISSSNTVVEENYYQFVQPQIDGLL